MPEINRRTFFKGSLASALLLSIGTCWPAAAARNERDRWLSRDDDVMLMALAGVMLSGSLPVDRKRRGRALKSLLADIERSVLRQPLHIRTELRELFDLLQLAPARLVLCGFWRDWSSASTQDIDDCLAWWRSSRLELLRLAYLSLNELIVFNYFSQPQSWLLIGYEGPPEIARPEPELR